MAVTRLSISLTLNVALGSVFVGWLYINLLSMNGRF